MTTPVYVQYSMTRCSWCGEHLLGAKAGKGPRSDKKFCNAKCRNRYHRWKHLLPAQVTRICGQIHDTAKYLAHPEAKEDAIQYMLGILKCVQFELGAANVRISIAK